MYPLTTSPLPHFADEENGLLFPPFYCANTLTHRKDNQAVEQGRRRSARAAARLLRPSPRGAVRGPSRAPGAPDVRTAYLDPGAAVLGAGRPAGRWRYRGAHTRSTPRRSEASGPHRVLNGGRTAGTSHELLRGGRHQAGLGRGGAGLGEGRDRVRAWGEREGRGTRYTKRSHGGVASGTRGGAVELAGGGACAGAGAGRRDAARAACGGGAHGSAPRPRDAFSNLQPPFPSLSCLLPFLCRAAEPAPAPETRPAGPARYCVRPPRRRPREARFPRLCGAAPARTQHVARGAAMNRGAMRIHSKGPFQGEPPPLRLRPLNPPAPWAIPQSPRRTELRVSPRGQAVPARPLAVPNARRASGWKPARRARRRAQPGSRSRLSASRPHRVVVGGLWSSSLFGFTPILREGI